VGLRLEAKTPSEIAVSIVAELVQVKNKGVSDAMLQLSAETDAQTEWRTPVCPV
jgi:xanthine/CO dehydrogenase XdhC/CoxF family maturation factor